MKSIYITIVLISLGVSGICQVDTISDNIYQKDGNLGIGTADPDIGLNIIDSNILIKVGHQPAYDGPYINLYGSSTEPAPMLGLGLANKKYYYKGDSLTMVDWSYIYGNNLNPGIAIVPDLEFASIGVYINREGKVGINTKQPKSQLDVNGGVRIGNTNDSLAGLLRWTGISFEGYDGSNWVTLSDSADNLWSQNNEGLYYESGNIGFGSTPNKHLVNIQSNINSGIERNLLKINNLADGSSSYSGIILKTGESEYQSVIQDYGLNYTASPHYDFGGFFNLANNSSGLMLHANSINGIIKFYTGYDELAGAGFERLRIDSAGNIGIGTKEPIAKLHVADGDIYISDIEKGIIMKSPDGNCWRGVLDNAGQLNFTKIDCPKAGITDLPEYLKSFEKVSVYPNPAGNSITVNLDINQFENPKYALYNINGQLVDTGKIKSFNETIDITNLSNGVYVISIFDKNGNKLSSEKIIKD